MPSAEIHRFESQVWWQGSTAVGYEAYDRSHRTSFPPVADALDMSAAPGFLGDAERLNPEQLLLAAASSCQLLSFLAVAARARLDVREYTDDAEALMSMAERPVRISRILLRPRILLGPGPSEARVRGLVERAHRECFIANTLDCDVVVDPEIHVGD